MQRLTGIEALFTLVDIFIIIDGVFLRKTKKGSLLIVLLFLFLVTGACAFFYPYTPLGQIAITSCPALCIIIPIAVCDMKFRDTIFVSIIVSGIVSGIVMLIVRIAEIVGISGMGLYVLDIIANCFSLGLCILAAKRILLRNTMHSLLLISGRIKLLLVATVWIGVILTYSLSLFLDIVPSSPSVITIALLSLVLVSISGILCPLIVADNISKNNYKAAFDATQRQMRNQVKHYETIIANDKEMKKFQHDYKNLYIGLRTYLSSNDNIGALQYLAQLNKPLENDYLAYNTGDIMLDALLADKQSQADSMSTTIQYEGMLPNGLLAPEDVCLIFGNAIDNALEACAMLPSDESKAIHISCVYSTGFLFIKIANPVLDDVEIYGNLVKSTKIDDGFHGIGLLSIQNAITNYSGTLTLRCTNNLFSLEADLDFNELAMSV